MAGHDKDKKDKRKEEGPLFEEYFQTLRTVKNHKMKKRLIKVNGKETAPGQLKKAEREYDIENEKGEKFTLKFHEGKKGGKNPNARMRIEVHDPDIPNQPDPARNKDDSIITITMENIGQWTATEIMLFVFENIMMPEQEIYNQFFGPQNAISISAESALNAAREFKTRSIINSGSKSELRGDFFTD